MLFKKTKLGNGYDFVVVGLGNPGKKYEGTRHNAGFMAIAKLADELGVKVDRVRFKSFCGDAVIGDKRVLLMAPQTFMNNSGEAVREALSFYKIPAERCLVICDDITLSVGTIRIRRKGSDGGQRGMRSIITLCGSEQFPRIKIGVGQKPHPDYDLAAWVLSRFTETERPALSDAIEHAAEAAKLIVQDNIAEAMNQYSR